MRSYIKARWRKGKEEIQERLRTGGGNAGFGELHTVMRDEEPVMLPGVGH